MAHYQTTDIFKGAFLLSKGGDLSGITFNDRQIASFAISGNGIHQLDRDYMTGKALVNPVILRESLNHLRDLLFELKRFNSGSCKPVAGAACSNMHEKKRFEMKDRRNKKDDRSRRSHHHQARR